ncbi:MAG: hypothetical protein AAGI52_09720 [Bacteroidota bacterium]
MTRFLFAILLALAPLTVHAQEAEPMNEDGCLGTDDSAGELCWRATCYTGGALAVGAFLLNSCNQSTSDPLAASDTPRRGVGVEARPAAPPSNPNPLLSPSTEPVPDSSSGPARR